MKAFFKIPMLVAIAVLLMAGSAMAFPFLSVEGTVNPIDASIVDNLDGTSTITGLEYIFTVKDDGGSGEEMDYLSLEFENDVFTTVSTAYSYNPVNWTSMLWSAPPTATSPGSINNLSFAGSTIGLGDSLSFMVDVDVFTAALTDDSFWDEGSVWAQSWSSTDTGTVVSWTLPNGTIVSIPGTDGGSTAPVPEPATMFLLGSGLAGLVAVVRRRKVRNS